MFDLFDLDQIDQTLSLLCSKGSNQLSEKVTYGMGESSCKP